MAPLGGEDEPDAQAAEVPRLRVVRDLGSEVTGARPLVLGFRRRCAWCGVQLRGWQLNMDRACKLRTGDAGLYLQCGGPPCGQGARWDDEPDRFEMPGVLVTAWSFLRKVAFLMTRGYWP
jgi:hypothetical protein